MNHCSMWIATSPYYSKQESGNSQFINRKYVVYREDIKKNEVDTYLALNLTSLKEPGILGEMVRFHMEVKIRTK